ncbi:MAG TPA: helix-turn-helix domain-containing protein [Vicinamibacterales bacterium]|jgi:AraC family ethanolamine operon transcriptional activator
MQPETTSRTRSERSTTYRGLRPSRPPVLSHQEVVARAEAYLRDHLDDQVPVTELCRIAGCSERALRNAFYGERGVSPKRFIVAERLRNVRRALNAASAGSSTVTGIAICHGFWELGRFAATYKAAFGESPSETLRRQHQRKGPGDVSAS